MGAIRTQENSYASAFYKGNVEQRGGLIPYSVSIPTLISNNGIVQRSLSEQDTLSIIITQRSADL